MRLSSPSLKDKWKEDPSVGEMLETTFHKFREAYDKFHTSGSSKEGEHFPDHFHCRYLEIYEQDDHCSTHLFQLKVSGCGLLAYPVGISISAPLSFANFSPPSHHPHPHTPLVFLLLSLFHSNSRLISLRPPFTESQETR